MEGRACRTSWQRRDDTPDSSMEQSPGADCPPRPHGSRRRQPGDEGQAPNRKERRIHARSDARAKAREPARLGNGSTQHPPPRRPERRPGADREIPRRPQGTSGGASSRTRRPRGSDGGDTNARHAPPALAGSRGARKVPSRPGGPRGPHLRWHRRRTRSGPRGLRAGPRKEDPRGPTPRKPIGPGRPTATHTRAPATSLGRPASADRTRPWSGVGRSQQRSPR